jgi:Fe-S-cluster containining protein
LTQQRIIGDKIQCGFLHAAGCAIYEVRPLICRIFGVGPTAVEKLRCPFLPLAPAMSMGLYLEMMDEYERLGELVPLEGEEAWKRWCAEADSEKPII